MLPGSLKSRLLTATFLEFECPFGLRNRTKMIPGSLKSCLLTANLLISKCDGVSEKYVLESGNQQALFRCACVFSKMFSKRFRLRMSLFFLKKHQLNNTVAGGFLKFKLFQKQKMCFAKRTPIQTHFSEKTSQAKTL